MGRALLLTLRYTGLRLKEVVTLRTEEVDLDARRISLVGKGRKPRERGSESTTDPFVAVSIVL